MKKIFSQILVILIIFVTLFEIVISPTNFNVVYAADEEKPKTKEKEFVPVETGWYADESINIIR